MSRIFPAVLDARTLQRQVWDVSTARAIPGVGRALALIGGLASQMPLDLYAGIIPQPRPPLLERPDLAHIRPLFTRMHVEDYLLHGNAAHLVTVRDSRGYPAAVRWFPAHAWGVQMVDGERVYTLHGRDVPPDEVVHVQNGVDPLAPGRGMGLVELHVRTLDRVAMQEAAEREALAGGSVPGVAVIMPAATDADEEELDEAADAWERKFGGPRRRPAVLPHGTTVTPLAWTPSDAQATEARELSLVDTANIFNVDAYWLGGKSSSHTYRSPGPLFLALLRTTIDSILEPLEVAWSLAWTPYGKRVVFDRSKVLGDDLRTTVEALTKASGGPVMTVNESRTVLRLAPIEGGDELRSAAAAADPDDADDPDDPERANDEPDDPDSDPEEDAA